MRCSVTDIGSNTVKVTVYDIREGVSSVAVMQTTPVGLASYRKNGVLAEDGIRKLCEVLNGYNALSMISGAEKTYCIATAGLRGLSNLDAVLDAVRQSCGTEITVISGEREAELAYLGFRDACRREEGTVPTSGILVDLGGGSTELITILPDKMGERISVNVGARLLFESFVSGSVPTDAELAAIGEYCAASFAGQLSRLPAEGKNVYITGGTAKSLVRLITAMGIAPHDPCSVGAFETLYKMLLFDRDSVLHTAACVIPDRTHLTAPGLIAFVTLFGLLKTERLHVAYSGIRDGFVADLLAGGLL